jgi:hypothetical protein
MMDMPEDLEPRKIPVEKWLYDQEYWSLNCSGDPSNCLGCRNWGGEGICLFDEDEEYKD